VREPVSPLTMRQARLKADRLAASGSPGRRRASADRYDEARKAAADAEHALAAARKRLDAAAIALLGCSPDGIATVDLDGESLMRLVGDERVTIQRNDDGTSTAKLIKQGGAR
jgi:hypothetical protein